ncbi:hypothetical protein PCANC_23658 [Puccinia coronata f. sp. avenae]|uniref:Uncharacterized protein n=1 Tax=Puccinia coronata f. sp. avenae TaxID=200324 RepID=A0A2N5TQR0_9BASI|nr:hypothetical protein PCANC_23658 [Puccinia coronata f. sp. avenae]
MTCSPSQSMPAQQESHAQLGVPANGYWVPANGYLRPSLDHVSAGTARTDADKTPSTRGRLHMGL